MLVVRECDMLVGMDVTFRSRVGGTWWWRGKGTCWWEEGGAWWWGVSGIAGGEGGNSGARWVGSIYPISLARACRSSLVRAYAVSCGVRVGAHSYVCEFESVFVCMCHACRDTLICTCVHKNVYCACE